ncbi:MAG: hypothetical protein ACRD4C_00140 [Candidatus Acidiferrales bacterium]
MAALTEVGGRGRFGSAVLARQIAGRGLWNDCANLPAIVQTASQQTRIGLVLADAEFDSERNYTYIRQQLGAQSVISAKHGRKPGASAECMHGCGGSFHDGSIVAAR